MEAAAAQSMAEADYYDVASGAGAMLTHQANRAAYRGRRILPRALSAPGSLQRHVGVLGATLSAPLYIAPMARQGRACPDGELASAAVAAELGVLFIASTRSTFRLEDIAASCPGPRWFQLYVMRDREVTLDLVRRAGDAGYGAIVVTVDGPVAGTRWRKGISESDTIGVDSDNLAGYFDGSGKSPLNYRSLIEERLGWADIEWLVERSPVPVALKGILHPADSVRAVEAGVAAVVVSNHGGRMLDRTPASLDALPAVAAAVAGRVPVLVDGGVRDGGDVLIACASGALCAGIGRPVMWALATGGRDGLRSYLTSIFDDLDRSLMLAGVRTPHELPADQLIGSSSG